MAKKNPLPSSALDNEQIAQGTEKIFERRGAFLVLGLTGRTGSGCSTVADELLCKPSFDKLQWRAVLNVPNNHEQRKDRIVEHWMTQRWTAFRKIQVSQVILSFCLEEDPIAFAQVVRDVALTTDVNALREFLTQEHPIASQHHKSLKSCETSSEAEITEAAEYYFNTLPAIAKSFKSIVSSRDVGLYTTLFQQLGDNIRRSGAPLERGVCPENLFEIPRRIEALIDLGRRANEISSINKHFFVIDAIRHPFEIHYLREKISRFLVVAVTTSEESRRSRLFNKVGLKEAEIKALDAKEYPKKKKDLTGYAQFVSQNIQDEPAPIFLDTNLG